MCEDDTPHDESEGLCGREKAGTASQLYRCHRLLAETRQDIVIRRMTRTWVHSRAKKETAVASSTVLTW